MVLPAEGLVFFTAVELTLFCRLVTETADCFSGKPPVLFLLVTETEFELREDPVKVDFATLELESELLFGSILFLTVAAALSTEVTEDCLSGILAFFAGSSPDCTTGSSILVQVAPLSVNQEQMA
ncbi:hypothetical protein L1049_009848 [Liquidambar formosana]|uniref:Uncharacterized protein n=1 Tax=Liquidambar formosana TaxID=63359 RepID=A0AAP0N6G6_LIQFO